jgi:hypothetical protein
MADKYDFKRRSRLLKVSPFTFLDIRTTAFRQADNAQSGPVRIDRIMGWVKKRLAFRRNKPGRCEEHTGPERSILTRPK